MNKSSAILLIFLSCLTFLMPVQSQKSVTVSCSAVGINVCASLFQYRITGTDLEESICVPEGTTCNLALNATYQVNNCTHDYMSIGCSTGICFYKSNVKIALLGGQCSTPYTQNISCGNCVAVTCASNNCQTLVKSGNQPLISCVDGCSSPSSVNVSVNACTGGQDALGTKNNCCMTFEGQAGAVCSTQNNILTASSKIKVYVKGTGSGSGKSQMNLLVMGMLMLMIIMILLG